MRSKLLLPLLVIVLFLVPGYSGASTVFETAAWITDDEGEGLVYEFVADKTPLTYRATISDLSVAPAFGLDDIFLSVSTSTSVLAYRSGEGSIDFDVVEGNTYFANVFAKAAGAAGAGNFGLLIQAVPIPPALILLGSGLIGLIALRRRGR